MKVQLSKQQLETLIPPRVRKDDPGKHSAIFNFRSGRQVSVDTTDANRDILVACLKAQ